MECAFPFAFEKTGAEYIAIQKELELINIDEVRKMFLSPNVIKPDTVSHNEINKNKLISFLCDQNNFSEERISNMINKLEKTQEERSESLDKWFK